MAGVEPASRPAPFSWDYAHRCSERPFLQPATAEEWFSPMLSPWSFGGYRSQLARMTVCVLSQAGVPAHRIRLLGPDQKRCRWRLTFFACCFRRARLSPRATENFHNSVEAVSSPIRNDHTRIHGRSKSILSVANYWVKAL